MKKFGSLKIARVRGKYPHIFSLSRRFQKTQKFMIQNCRLFGQNMDIWNMPMNQTSHCYGFSGTIGGAPEAILNVLNVIKVCVRSTPFTLRSL